MIWPAALLASLLGACVGSFAATFGLRHAEGRVWSHGRSNCDHCATSLSILNTLPVLSYAMTFGRCRQCRGPIDPVHPIGEILGAVLAPLCLMLLPPLQAGLLFTLGMALLASSVVDLKTMRLPDALTAVIAALCLCLVLVRGPSEALTGALSAAVLVALVQALRMAGFYLRREPGLGLGDLKLLAVLAFWLGLATPWAVAAAAILGLAVVVIARPTGGRLPFGPFIAVACYSVGFVQEVRQWPVAV